MNSRQELCVGEIVWVANPLDNDNLDEMKVIDIDKTSNIDIILERKTNEWIDSCGCSSDDIKLGKTGKYVCYTIGWFSRDEVDLMNGKQLCIGDDVWVQCLNGKMLKMEVNVIDSGWCITMDYIVLLVAKDDQYKYECSCNIDKIQKNDDGEWELGKHYHWFTQDEL